MVRGVGTDETGEVEEGSTAASEREREREGGWLRMKERVATKR